MSETPPLRVTESGVAFVRLGGESYRLPMPTLGQFQDLKQRYHEVADDVAELTEDRLASAVLHGTQVDAVLAAAVEAGRSEHELTDEERAQVRALRRAAKAAGRDIVDQQVERWLDWWEFLFATLLGDSKAPARDRFEPWMQNATTVGSLLMGWQFDPLAPGAS